MYTMFDHQSKPASALQEQDKELQLQNNAQWVEDRCLYNDLPDDLYLPYILVDKQLRFCFNGGEERNKVIRFETYDKNIYDEFSLFLVNEKK